MSDPHRHKWSEKHWQLVGAAVGVLMLGALYTVLCGYGPIVLKKLMYSF